MLAGRSGDDDHIGISAPNTRRAEKSPYLAPFVASQASTAEIGFAPDEPTIPIRPRTASWSPVACYVRCYLLLSAGGEGLLTACKGGSIGREVWREREGPYVQMAGGG